MQNNWASRPSPHSPTLSPSEGPWAWWATVALLGAIVAVTVAASIVAVGVGIGLHAFDPYHPLANPRFALVLQLVLYVPMGAVVAVGVPLVARSSLRELGVRKPKRRDLVVALVGVAAMYAVTVAVAAAVAAFKISAPEAAVELLKSLRTPLDRGLFVATAVVGAPIVEEAIFRLFLLNALLRYLPVGWALGISSLLFGAIHASGSGSGSVVAQLLAVGLPLTAAGAVLGAVYLRTRCYWADVTTHALFNGIQVGAFLLWGVT